MTSKATLIANLISEKALIDADKSDLIDALSTLLNRIEDDRENAVTEIFSHETVEVICACNELLSDIDNDRSLRERSSDIATLEQEIRQVRARLNRLIDEHEEMQSTIKVIRTWAYCDSLHNKHVVDLCDKTLEKMQ